MSEEEVDLLVSGMEDNQGQINYEGICSHHSELHCLVLCMLSAFFSCTKAFQKPSLNFSTKRNNLQLVNVQLTI